jgi:hypothetical protein
MAISCALAATSLEETYGKLPVDEPAKSWLIDGLSDDL